MTKKQVGAKIPPREEAARLESVKRRNSKSRVDNEGTPPLKMASSPAEELTISDQDREELITGYAQLAADFERRASESHKEFAQVVDKAFESLLRTLALIENSSSISGTRRPPCDPDELRIAWRRATLQYVSGECAGELAQLLGGDSPVPCSVRRILAASLGGSLRGFFKPPERRGKKTSPVPPHVRKKIQFDVLRIGHVASAMLSHVHFIAEREREEPADARRRIERLKKDALTRLADQHGLSPNTVRQMGPTTKKPLHASPEVSAVMAWHWYREGAKAFSRAVP